MSTPVKIVSLDKDLAAKLAQAIGARVSDVSIKSFDNAVDLAGSIVICDASYATDAHIKFIETVSAITKVILVFKQDADQIIPWMVRFPNVNHVFGMFDDKHPALLVDTVARCVRNGDAGLDGYMGGGVLSSFKMTRYSEAAKIIAAIRELGTATGSFSELPNILATVASEMIMNACFDAPVDRASGKPKYANLQRSADLVLDDSESVQINYGVGKSHFIISVRDNFGALDRRTVVDNLARCAARGTDQVRREAAGAGIGLYMLFRYTTQLDFRIDPDRSTEVIAVVSLSKRFKEYELNGPCVNFYVRGRR